MGVQRWRTGRHDGDAMAKLVKDLNKFYLKMMFYGRPGSLKTRTVGSAAMDPRLSPCLMLSMHGNPISLRGNDQLPTIIEITEMRDFNDIYTFLANGQQKVHPLWTALNLTEPFKSLVIDGATNVNYKAFDLITGWEGDDNFERLSANTEPGHYKQNMDTMMHWAGKFVSLADLDAKLPVHVLMTALEREPAIDFRSRQGKAEGQRGPSPASMLYRPSFLGQAGVLIEGLVEAIARMVPVSRFDTEDRAQLKPRPGAKFAAIWLPGDDFVAKDQVSRHQLGAVTYDPTMTTIMDVIYGTVGEPLPTTQGAK